MNVSEALSQITDDAEKELIGNVWHFIRKNSPGINQQEIDLTHECTQYFGGEKRKRFASVLDEKVIELATRLRGNEGELLEGALTPLDVANLIWHLMTRLCLEAGRGIKHST